MTSKWIFTDLTDEQQKCQENIAQKLSVDPILAKLLVQRGITSFEEARLFFRPTLTSLHDPFLMADMAKAVDRLNCAIGHKEKILIYGDYDVDGTTAVALVYKFLQRYTSNVAYYVPDRYTEGYGISMKGIDFAAEHGFQLVITLDCGIKAVEKVDYANSLGVDFIICDHHNPDEKLPNAVAVLDPKRLDCNYPYKHLSGCGVGFKLIQAFAISNDIPFSELTPLLDLVAVSIASDIVPITGENRTLMFFGLKQLNTFPSIGLQSIIDVSDLKGKEISVSDIVFKLGPRINASGRMRTATEVVDLLVSKDVDFAREKSDSINELNNDRKDLDKNITEEAIFYIKNNINYETRKSIVVYNPDWHKGVVGIVASRLSEEYYKPTVVLTSSNGLATGSARSVPGFDLYAAIDSCRDLLDNFGGHLYAAGLSMKVENVEEFSRRFEKYVSENILPEQLTPQTDIDAIIDFNSITPKFMRILKQFAPFGPGNMKPIFVTKNTIDAGTSRLVGKEQEHLKLDLRDPSNSSVMGGIAFKMGHFFDTLKSKKPIDVCYTLEENFFAGNTTIQLMVREIQKSEENSDV